MAKRWMDDLGFGWEQMPNFKVHSQADEEHSDMFFEDLERFAIGEKEALGLSSRERVDGVAEDISRRHCEGDGTSSLSAVAESFATKLLHHSGRARDS